jgi:N-acetylneuraminate synthase
MLNEIKIDNKIIGPTHPVFVIAEAGINHNGSFSIAKKLIDVAKNAGADCIKFQTHITEEEMTRTNIPPGKISKKPLWNIIKSCELTEDEELKLNKYCKGKKIIFLSTPFSIPAVDRLEKIKIPAYKIGSGELTNLPFLRCIAKKRKPVILSTGMSNMEEIKSAVRLFKKAKTPLAILQTTSEYPCNYNDVNLGVIDRYKKLFKVPIGISDHSLGIYTALGAVAKGACIVEKHITLDKKMLGPDQKLSLEPDELAELVKGCRAIKLALGDTKKILKKELPVLRFARESVVTKEKISKGDIFSEENLTTKRPNTGQIPAKDFYKVIGRKAKRNIPKNKQLLHSDII